MEAEALGIGRIGAIRLHSPGPMATIALTVDQAQTSSAACFFIVIPPASRNSHS